MAPRVVKCFALLLSLYSVLVVIEASNRNKTTTLASSLGSQSSTYYLDSARQCTSSGAITKYFTYFDEFAYVKSWGTSPHRPNPTYSGSCSITFASRGSDGMRFRFQSSSDHIYDCSVKLNIYAGSSVYSGNRLRSYSCYDPLPESYKHTSSGYITVELVNYVRSTNYDFTLVITNYDDISSTGEIVGITVGAVALLTLLIVLLIVRRRRRWRRLRGDVLITSSSTSNYNYPAGAAPYQQPTYGSVTATTTNYPPPPPNYAPPPPNYAPPSYPGGPAPAGAVS